MPTIYMYPRIVSAYSTAQASPSSLPSPLHFPLLKPDLSAFVDNPGAVLLPQIVPERGPFFLGRLFGKVVERFCASYSLAFNLAKSNSIRGGRRAAPLFCR